MGQAFRLLCAILVLVAMVAPRQALAHAVLLDTEPPADMVLDEAPARIVLRFNEPVRPVLFRVLDADGQLLAGDAEARAVDQAVELALPETLPRGGYILSWRVISADSHPVGGSFRFAVGAFPERWEGNGALGFEQQDARFWTIASAAARGVFLAALLASAGGAWFVTVIARRQAMIAEHVGRLVRRFALTGAASAATAIGLQGGLLLAAPPSQLLSMSSWAAGFATPIGWTLLASCLLLMLLAAVSRPVPARLSVIAGLFAVLPLALAGHVATAEPRWLTGPSIAVHLVVAAFWFGSLPPLFFAVKSLSAPDAARILERFSAWAVGAVVLLVAAGTTIAVIQLGNIPALWQTTYGLVLGSKLVLVAGVLTIATYNKMVLTGALAAGQENAAKHLSRTIALEIVLIGFVIVLTAALSFNTPPGSLSKAEGQGHHHDHDHAHGDGHDHHHHEEPDGHSTIERQATVRGTRVTLDLSPGRAGVNNLHIVVEDSQGTPVEPLEVEARFSSTDLGIEPVARRLERRNDRYEVETADMALPGIWRIRIDVLVSDFDKPIFEFEVDVR